MDATEALRDVIMEFPKRPAEHVIQSQSWKVFQAKTPTNWIIREVTERDYGIDAYIEFATNNGEISGELCSIQLKGTKGIKWSGEPKASSARKTIKQSTVNYWMKIPVPVFLILADITKEQAYFAPIKSLVRKQFVKHLKQRTLSFKLDPQFELGTQYGDVAFLVEYFKERRQERLGSTLREFMIHWEQYLSFIQDYQGRDQHLGIECDEELMFQHVYESTQFLASCLGVECSVPPLASAYEAEAKWKDPYYRLHQFTVELMMRHLEPVFLRVIEACGEFLLGSEYDYWKLTDPALVAFCPIVNMKPHIERLQSRGRIKP